MEPDDVEVTAYNTHHLAVECAGVRWPARTTTTHTLPEARVGEVWASRRLRPHASGGAAAGLDGLTVPELRSQLEQRGLDTSGLKAELVERLRAAEG